MTSEFQMTMDEYLPLRDVVFQTLRKAILRGELKPGERLMEIALANRLGVSRTPVREAIRMLEQEGLVIMIPRKGAQVAQITMKDLNDVLEVRLGLEELAMQFACKRITQEEIGEMKQALEEIERLQEAEDVTALAEADVAFHDIIYKATDNKRLNQIINNVREQMYRYRVEYLKDSRTRGTLLKEHREIYEAVAGRDEERAKACIRCHIMNQQQSIARSLRDHA